MHLSFEGGCASLFTPWPISQKLEEFTLKHLQVWKQELCKKALIVNKQTVNNKGTKELHFW